MSHRMRNASFVMVSGALVIFATFGFYRPTKAFGQIDPQTYVMLMEVLDGEAEQPFLLPQLRKGGYGALDRLLNLRDTLSGQLEAAEPMQRMAVSAKLNRLEHLLARVSGQRWFEHSRLFWHDDYEQALAASQRDMRPILALDMRGSLTDASSGQVGSILCAVYSDPRVANILRQQFVLYAYEEDSASWIPGREASDAKDTFVPIHSLVVDGAVVDARLGLMGPKMLIDWLNVGAAVDWTELGALTKYHQQRQSEVRVSGTQSSQETTEVPLPLSLSPLVVALLDEELVLDKQALEAKIRNQWQSCRPQQYTVHQWFVEGQAYSQPIQFSVRARTLLGL